jgi:hypothetical protein
VSSLVRTSLTLTITQAQRGTKDLGPGIYDLTWFDTVDGGTIREDAVVVDNSSASWAKPPSMSDEVALY